MLRFAFPYVLTALLLQLAGAAPARADDADKDVKAIIAKAVKAKGGAANLEKYKAVVSKFTGTISSPGMEIKISGTSKDQAPDKTRLDAEVSGGATGSFSEIFDGKKGWQQENGNLKEMNKTALAEVREQAYSGQLAEVRGLAASGLKITALGESKIEGKSAVGLRVSAAGHRDVSLFFGKDDGLLLKTETVEKDAETGTEFNAASFYSDYKDVGGLKMAHKAKVLRDGKPFMQVQMTSVSLAEKLDDKEFAKP